MTFHTQVVGANGQRQAMAIERMPGLAEVDPLELPFRPARRDDRLLGGRVDRGPGRDGARCTNSRTARRRCNLARASRWRSDPDLASGRRLADEADLVIDLCTPHADALIAIDGVDTPVGPGSTLTAVAIVNSIKVRTAQLLAERGAMPPIITRASVVGAERSRALFDAAYQEHARRIARALTAGGVMATGTDAEEVAPIDAHRPTSTQGQSVSQFDDAARSARRIVEEENGSINGSTAQAAARPGSDRGPRGRVLEPGARPTTAPSASAPARVQRGGRRRSRRRPRPPPQYKIGYSNGGGVGNGFREEQVCTAKAEALASGQVSQLTDDPPQHGRSRPAPGHPRPDRRRRRRDRVQPERSRRPQPGARGGQGRRHPDHLGRRLRHRTPTPTTCTTTRSSTRSSAPSGCSSSSAARATSTTRAASPATRPTATATSGSRKPSQDYPSIKVVPTADGVATGWDPAKATQLINDFLSSGAVRRHPGHLDVGHGLAGRRRHQGRRQAVRADRRCRPRRVRQPAPRPRPGLKGAAVTNTAAVGGAGVNLALKILNGETAETDPSATQPNTVLLKPVLADNVERRRQDDARVVAGGRARPALAARSADRGLHHVHPRAGRRLQGPGRVSQRPV